MFKYILTSLAFLCFGINPAIAQVLCFKSKLKDESIQLQLTLPGEDSKRGQIRYKNGANDIEIRRTKETILSGRKIIPAAVGTAFSEIIDGKRTGTYFLITQGVAVGELTYQQLGKRKVYKFYDDQDSYTVGLCSWANENRNP